MSNIRQLTDHIVSGDQAHQLTITVEDEPGQGGACHRYVIRGFDAGSNTSHNAEKKEGQFEKVILFQNGPIKEFGINGLTHEALLAILIDRLKGFQSGPFASKANQYALLDLEDALFWLQERTRDRLSRGVEGTNQQ